MLTPLITSLKHFPGLCSSIQWVNDVILCFFWNKTTYHLCGQSIFGIILLLDRKPGLLSSKRQKKNALDRNNPRDRMEKLKRRTQGAELFFPGSYKFMVLGVLPHDPQWQSKSLLPDIQTQKTGGHFAWLKPANKGGKGVPVVKFEKFKNPKVWKRAYVSMPARWWHVISGTRRFWAVVFAKWYSWKALENRAALDRSNDDPAGRAEQLKKSPGERWELLTATEGLYSGALLRPRADENIAGNNKKH